MSLRRVSLFLLLLAFVSVPLIASDHADAVNNAEDRSTDLGDGYLFLDPNDNSKVIVLMTFSGFIVPGENVNFGVFSEDVRYTLDFENTGDATIDQSYFVTFGPKTAPTAAQTATIRLPNGTSFTAPTTPPSNTAETAPAPVVTTDPASGVSFFAGLVDDPFFFDIPAFGRFLASVRAGAPDATVFNRGRDSFAGYNILAIGLSIPKASLMGSSGETIKATQSAQRRVLQVVSTSGRTVGSGRWVTADRQGLPAINTALIPFARKREYNRASPESVAGGDFAADAVATLTSLGTNQENIGILANLAVATGDMLSLNLNTANSGPGGGNNSGAGFPNGRRLADDVIDTIFFFIANQNALSDSVPSNDRPFTDTFPFFALAHQPRATGVLDDSTRN